MTYFKNVVKRNGITVPFDEKKIENAIAKAFIATGEVEARNVEHRLDLSQEDKREKPPWETEDIDDEKQILREKVYDLIKKRHPRVNARRLFQKMINANTENEMRSVLEKELT